jgi:hypothetical protein
MREKIRKGTGGLKISAEAIGQIKISERKIKDELSKSS